MAESTQRDRVDFINFIIDATGNQELARKFLKCSTVEELKTFFEDHEYYDVPENDCKDILLAAEKFKGLGVTEQGDPIDITSRGGY